MHKAFTIGQMERSGLFLFLLMSNFIPIKLVHLNYDRGTHPV